MALYRHTINALAKCAIANLRPGTPPINFVAARYIKRWVAPTLRELQRRRNKAGPVPPQPRSTYLEWNYDAEIFAFGKRLNEEFDDNVLRKALTHRSYVWQQEVKAEEDPSVAKPTTDNKELISRGSEIISRFITSEFGKQYPEVLTKVVRDYLTQDTMLAYVATHIGLKDIVLCSETTLADAFKAVVGAVDASSGAERAEMFVKDFLVAQLNGKDVYDLWNPNDAFQQLERMLEGTTIEPRLCNQSASNTILANYQVGLYTNKNLIGIGFGESIEIAKGTAALDAIRKIHKKQFSV